VKSCTLVHEYLSFWGNCRLALLVWRWRHQLPPKRNIACIYKISDGLSDNTPRKQKVYIHSHHRWPLKPYYCLGTFLSSACHHFHFIFGLKSRQRQGTLTRILSGFIHFLQAKCKTVPPFTPQHFPSTSFQIRHCHSMLHTVRSNDNSVTLSQ